MPGKNVQAFNPWHNISAGDGAPEIVNGIIEIPKGTRAKYELDKETGLLMLDRVLYASMYYPANYGFIPRSYCDDNDPLDILIISQIDIVPLCKVSARVVGVMQMLDQGEADDKIIAVAAGDPSVNHIDDISGLAPHFQSELQAFFEDYKNLENKTVKINEFGGREMAQEIVQASFDLYDQLFGKSEG